MRKLPILITVPLVALLLLPLHVVAQTAEQPIVQAILFYSQSCPHCHQVINELLIPMQEEYGDQLQIIGIDTTHPVGSELYNGAIEQYEIPKIRLGVPTLIVGEFVLVGSAEIPARFPTIVEDGLSAGGIGWPDIPGLAISIPDLPPSAGPGAEAEKATQVAIDPEGSSQEAGPVSAPTAVSAGEDMTGAAAQSAGGTDNASTTVQSLENVKTEEVSSVIEEPPADPVGFGLAWLVLIGMVAALVYIVWLIIIARPSLLPATNSPSIYKLSWAVPVLALIGLGASLYLSYVEVARVEAVCGPVGECNIVQASPYASLLGIPIAVLGALSYIAIIALWAGHRFLSDRLSALSFLGLIILTIFGTGFSIYLTMLELFAIQAICAWCLSSAVIMTLLMVLVVTTATKRPAPMKLGVHR
jgi:uncharacterized membrane protein/thiol-disulfide isomerase/thioredoxin